MDKKMGKKGQVTIFILIAIVIFAVLLIIFYPRIRAVITPAEPVGLVEECLANDVDLVLERISMQGGSLNPQLSLANEGTPVEYLCYTNLYYKPCVIQQPLLKQHIEREIQDYLDSKARACVFAMKSEMEKRGSTVSVNYKETKVEIVPDNVNIILDAQVSVRREGTQSFNGFSVKKSSRLYDLVMISSSIVNLETRLGDIETLTYMTYYPNLVVEKLKLGDGSKLYTITDITSDEQFVFATRSYAFPGGHKLTL